MGVDGGAARVRQLLLSGVGTAGVRVPDDSDGDSRGGHACVDAGGDHGSSGHAALPPGKRVGGRQSIRCYPHDGAGQLGAHIDSNMLTMLWANGPGLEVCTS
jgi:hypothetical protein